MKTCKDKIKAARRVSCHRSSALNVYIVKGSDFNVQKKRKDPPFEKAAAGPNLASALQKHGTLVESIYLSILNKGSPQCDIDFF